MMRRVEHTPLRRVAREEVRSWLVIAAIVAIWGAWKWLA